MREPDAFAGGERRWVFVVELDTGRDLYLHALAPFPVQGAQVRRIDLQRLTHGARLEVEAENLTAMQADRLRARLESLVGVLSVGCGWRVPA